MEKIDRMPEERDDREEMHGSKVESSAALRS